MISGGIMTLENKTNLLRHINEKLPRVGVLHYCAVITHLLHNQCAISII
jgi:hypothetical protein